jgi:hypothetical protein
MNDDRLRPHSEAYDLCVKALKSGGPDSHAQLYATLSVEEALRDLAESVSRAADTIARALRQAHRPL